MNTTRRGFLLGMGAAIAAPAIVRFESLMPVRNRLVPIWEEGESGEYFIYSKELSDVLRAELMPLSRFKQLADAAPGNNGLWTWPRGDRRPWAMRWHG